MVTTTQYNFPRSRDGKTFWYPDKLGHAWCAIQYVHKDEDNSGHLHFYVANTEVGGTDLDIEVAMINGHNAFEGPYPSLMKLDTLNVFSATLVPIEVDALFGNRTPSDFWATWMTLSGHFEINEIPERLIPTLNLVYQALEATN
jgi:hypothetical protein